MDYQQLKKRYFLELQEQLAKAEKRHVEEVEGLSAQLSHQIQYNNSLFDQLQQLGQQQQVASKFAQEAKALIAKITSQKDAAAATCEQLQSNLEKNQHELIELDKTREALRDENEHLKSDNQLFRNELMHLKDDLADYRQKIEQLTEEENTPDNGADSIQADLDMVRKEVDHLNQLLASERERTRALEGALGVERADHKVTAVALRGAGEETKMKIEEIERLIEICGEKDMEHKSISLDVEFLRGELKSAHKHAATYAMERDERATVCDALVADARSLKDRIAALEQALDASNKEKEANAQQAINDMNILRDENAQLLENMEEMDQARHNDLIMKENELEEVKHRYEEGMKEHYSVLSQQYLALQNGLQDEIRRLLQEKNTVVQNAREERLYLEASISSLSAKLNALEVSSKERETRDREEIERLKRENERVSQNYNSYQNSSMDVFNNLMEEVRECRETSVDLIAHYAELMRNVSPLSVSVRALAEEQSTQAETSLDQLHQLHQQYTSLCHDMAVLQDEKHALEIVHEEARSQALMMEETQSKLQRTVKDLENKLEAMQERARVAETRNQEIGILRSNIQSLHEELQNRAMRESSLQAKLDVAGSQLTIMTEENVKSAQHIAEVESEFSHRIAEADEHLEALNIKLRTTTEERDAVMRDFESAKADIEALRAQKDALAKKIDSDKRRLDEKQKEIDEKEKAINNLTNQSALQKQAMEHMKQQASQVQGSVIALQEQRKQLQSDNMELKEELDYLYKHQQMVTSLQQQRHVGGPEPVSDKSIMSALAKQNKIIEEKCKVLQDNAAKLMRDFTLPSSILAVSPDTSSSSAHQL